MAHLISNFQNCINIFPLYLGMEGSFGCKITVVPNALYVPCVKKYMVLLIGCLETGSVLIFYQVLFYRRGNSAYHHWRCICLDYRLLSYLLISLLVVSSGFNWVKCFSISQWGKHRFKVREGGDIELFIILVPKVLLERFLIRWL